MGVKEPFKIKREMVEDEKYFDKLFAGWYEEQARKIRGGGSGRRGQKDLLVGGAPTPLPDDLGNQ